MTTNKQELPTATIKSAYADYLRTDDGQFYLKEAIKIKKMWVEQLSNGVCANTTKNVKLKNLPKEITDKMVLITINPIGINNNCFGNSKFMEEEFGYEKVLGYSVIACDCNKITSFELHSVNRKDGVYYDITRDFAGETEKWFIPIEARNIDGIVYTKMLGEKQFVNVNKRCKCCNPIKGDKDTEYLKDFSPFIKKLDMYKKMIVWG